MTNTTFQLDIVSPERVVFSHPVFAVEVPGVEGDFGVLAEHAPLVSAVRTGVITVDRGPEGKREFFVTSGYAEVSGEGECTILTEHVQCLSDISADAAREAMEQAARVLDHAEGDIERARAQKLYDQAQALYHATTGR